VGVRHLGESGRSSKGSTMKNKKGQIVDWGCSQKKKKIKQGIYIVEKRKTVQGSTSWGGTPRKSNKNNIISIKDEEPTQWGDERSQRN